VKVLLVSPQTPATFWSFKHVLPFVAKRAVFPPLGLLTVAALLPRSWELKLVDLNVSRLRDVDLRWADYVMISAMIVHKTSVHEIIARCKATGRPVIGGGPLFTTGHEEFEQDVHCVLGEAEDLMEELVRDLETGQLRPVYTAKERPDISQTPVPRWDLIEFRHYVTMPIQFSRGCPFDCEFCDIVIMNGRVPRTKSPDQMIAELNAIYERGWDGMVFLVDDNFIGNKGRVKKFLAELVRWRERTGFQAGFFTEASVDLADDPQLLDLMAKAGFKRVFLGIETSIASSLEECHKIQNTRRDLAESIRVIQRSGMEVMGGFIVGFDNDPLDVFEQQFEFIQRTGIVTAMVGLLTALPQTRLYQRLQREGRLLTETTGNNTEAVLNFVPQLDRNFLISGYRRLMRALYEPKPYYERILTLLTEHRTQGPTIGLSWIDFKAFLKSLWLMGVWHRGRRAFWQHGQISGSTIRADSGSRMMHTTALTDLDLPPRDGGPACSVVGVRGRPVQGLRSSARAAELTPGY
jgi:radical SAM superfamily enzyme YgiQ (UPF0313 family)